MHRRILIILGGFILAAGLVSAAPVAAAPAKTRVARVVFIGKKKACACTKRKIADAWKALKAGLGQRRIPVVRFQADVKPAEAARYKKKRAYKVVPAVYFLTAAGQVVDLLQGIVTTADVEQVLGGR